MALSDDEVKDLIINQVGDVDVNGAPTTSSSAGVIALNIDNLWDFYELIPDRLKYLYVRRDAIELVIARVAPKVNTQIGNLQLSRSQHARALGQMRDALLKRITAVERSIRAGTSMGAIGVITVVTPVLDIDQPTFIANIR